MAMTETESRLTYLVDKNPSCQTYDKFLIMMSQGTGFTAGANVMINRDYLAYKNLELDLCYYNNVSEPYRVGDFANKLIDGYKQNGWMTYKQMKALSDDRVEHQFLCENIDEVATKGGVFGISLKDHFIERGGLSKKQFACCRRVLDARPKKA